MKKSSYHHPSKEYGLKIDDHCILCFYNQQNKRTQHFTFSLQKGTEPKEIS